MKIPQILTLIPEYFFSFFKKRTGLTPLEYRSFGREE